MSRIKVLLADDHTVVREGLARLLESDFDVLASVGDGRTAVTQASALRPNVVLLDIGLPLLNGVEATAQIRADAPQTKVIMLTQYASREYLQAAFRIGCSGYVLKNAAASELIRAINEVVAGGTYVSEELQQRFGPTEISRRDETTPMFAPVLTQRQREVLQLVAEGKSAKEIAHLLTISVKTVEFHKAAIMDQLGMRTTAELTRYAVAQGMVPVAALPV